MASTPVTPTDDVVSRQRVRVRVRKRRRRRRRHPVRRFVLLALVILVVAAAISVWTALPAVAAARDARARIGALQGIGGSLSAVSSPATLTMLDTQSVRIMDDLRVIEGTWGFWRGPALFVTGLAPSLHGQLEQVAPLLEYGRLVAQAGHQLHTPLAALTVVAPGHDHTGTLSSPALLTRLAAARPALRAAARTLDQAAAARRRVAVSTLPSWARRPLSRLDPALSQGPPALQMALALPSALGMDGPRDYLVVPQNSQDIRATGGFIGTVGVLHVDHGHARLIHLQDSYAVDRAHRPDVDAPLPLRVHGWLPWYFRDANWSADYPTTARLLEVFYQIGTGRHVDGVIAFDSSMAPDLLTLTGPVRVPDYNETLTAANAFQRIDYYVNDRTYVDASKNKDFALAAYKAVFAHLFSLPAATGQQALDTFGAATRARHLLLYANDAGTQAGIRAAGADGAIDGTTGDYLYVVDTNTSTSKIAQLVQRQISYRAVVQADHSIQATTTITYTNTADYHNLPHALGVDLPNFNDFVRVYVPNGSKLLGTTGLSESWWPTYTVHGKTQFSGYFTLRARQSRTLTFRYRITANVDPAGRYTLLVQKQPGAAAAPIQLALTAVDGVRLSAAPRQPLTLDDNINVTAAVSGGHAQPQPLPHVPAPVARPGSHPEPWVTVPTGWVSLPTWAAIDTGAGPCHGGRTLCHVQPVFHKMALHGY